MSELNPYVNVSYYNGELNEKYLKEFKVVVVCEGDIDNIIEINKICHENDICFILSQCCGVFSRVFCDFGENFVTNDNNGEEPSMCLISNITNDKNGIVNVLEEKRHNLSDGDYVKFSDIQGMTELNDLPPQPIKVITPYSFSIGDTSNYHQYTNRGYVLEVKQPQKIHFDLLEKLLSSNDYGMFNSDNGNSYTMHVGFQALDLFIKKNKRFPNYGSEEDAKEVVENAKEIKLKLDVDIDENLIYRFALQSKGSISPFAALIGGIVGQEVLKACSNKYTPIHQFLYFDCSETLPDEELPESEYISNTRYEGEIGVYGKTIVV